MKIILRATLIATLIAILVYAISIICIYFLWNWLMPDLIMAKEITFTQALGIRTLVQFCMCSYIHDKN